jgi:hypothetical protein
MIPGRHLSSVALAFSFLPRRRCESKHPPIGPYRSGLAGELSLATHLSGAPRWAGGCKWVPVCHGHGRGLHGVDHGKARTHQRGGRVRRRMAQQLKALDIVPVIASWRSSIAGDLVGSPSRHRSRRPPDVRGNVPSRLHTTLRWGKMLGLFSSFSTNILVNACQISIHFALDFLKGCLALRDMISKL